MIVTKNTQRLFSLFMLSLLMILLSSCSHVARKDGAPNFYVDETKVPNAVPKPEPLAKYGNMPSYKVFGKRYYTLKSSKHYTEVGVASWYGTMFHEQRTSSGEPYDMLGMTAAHKTLPLPTYVEVTNLKNNRKIIVKVNDRGPFEGNRIIDLSYVAAKKLGMLGHGTTLVRIKAIDTTTHYRDQPTRLFANNNRSSKPQTTYSHPSDQALWGSGQPSVSASSRNVSSFTISDSSSKSVYLQVGAFKDKSRAVKLQRELASMLDAPVKISPPAAKDRLYRVQVGPLKDAASAASRLKQLGLKFNKSYGV